MALEDERRRLPVVGALPRADDRHRGPQPTGEVPTPRLAVWELTLRCDQKCIHCGSRAGPARPNELTTEDALALVHELRELGVGEVTLVGGEAYLRNDFIRVIREVRMAGMSCTFTTGGLNLHPARCQAMAEAGVSQVGVSIDGMRDEHDRLRGVVGSWDAAFRALANLQAVGIGVAVNSQINRLTWRSLPELLERIVEAGARAWQLQITAAFGNAADHPEILIQPYMYPELFDELERVADRCRELGVLLWPANNLGYFGPLEARLRRYQRQGGHYQGCMAGQLMMGIEADGRIKGCPSLGGAANAAGLYRPGNLREIWQGAGALRYTRERATTHLWGYCAECYYGDVCRGGCTATAEPLLGRPGNNPFCHHRALEMQRMGLRERVELVERAPGEPFDHGLYRVVREHLDPERRVAEGPVAIEGPRTGRDVEPDGPGQDVPAVRD